MNSMKKFLIFSLLAFLVSGMISCSSCNKNKEKENTEVVTDLNVENCISADREKMFLSHGKDYRWFETCMRLKSCLDEDNDGTLEELVKLPGVGRKTANCVLVFAFELPAIPVDTHVHRISNRMGLVNTKNPDDTEMELSKIAPKELWIKLNDLMVQFGQNICKPTSPQCEMCPVSYLCDYDGS